MLRFLRAFANSSKRACKMPSPGEAATTSGRDSYSSARRFSFSSVLGPIPFTARSSSQRVNKLLPVRALATRSASTGPMPGSIQRESIGAVNRYPRGSRRNASGTEAASTAGVRGVVVWPVLSCSDEDTGAFPSGSPAYRKTIPNAMTRNAPTTRRTSQTSTRASLSIIESPGDAVGKRPGCHEVRPYRHVLFVGDIQPQEVQVRVDESPLELEVYDAVG